MPEMTFEKISARFVSAAALSLPESLRSLAFASPLSARSPDICMLWHDRYREKHRIKLLWNLLAGTFYGFFKGAVKLLVNPKPLKYAVYGRINSAILVMTSMCGFETSNGAYKTAYVRTDDDDGIFVFGPVNTCGKDEKDIEELSLRYKLLYTLNLMRSGIYAFIKVDGNLLDKTLLILKWFEWVVSLQWLYVYYLERTLSEVVEKYKITKVGCIHEMHFYSRVVWQVASKYKAKGYTVQHAAVTSGKRWYFCYPEEKESGLILPDVMYIYNEKVARLLEPYMVHTRFIPGCSYRYSQWKALKKIKADNGRYYLFVGALAGFDNDVLMASLRRLVDMTKASIPIRLRLHPYAKIRYKDRRWLRANAEKGIIDISKDASLESDIESAIAVIGMSTTVLEEALLMGRPVIQLMHPDYLQYIDIEGVKGVTKLDFRELSMKDLLEVSDANVNSEEMKERLGLNNAVVTYERLFSEDVRI